MDSKCIVVIVVLINCLLCHSFEPECHTGTLNVPVAVVIILASAFLLMVLLLLFLLYILVKMKGFHIFHSYKVRPENIISAVSTSSEVKSRLNLENSNGYELKIATPNLIQKPFNECDTLKSIKTEFNGLQTNDAEITGDKPVRPMRCIGKDMPVILPEQMSQICREVLRKTNKNSDVGGNIDKLLHEVEPKTDEKCASRSVLDLYDVVPSTLKCIKDTTKEEKVTQETAETRDFLKPKLNYMEPCCTLLNSHNTTEKESLSPPCDYAVLSGISVPHNKVDDNYYQFPNPCPDENNLYINANVNRHKAD